MSRERCRQAALLRDYHQQWRWDSRGAAISSFLRDFLQRGSHGAAGCSFYCAVNSCEKGVYSLYCPLLNLVSMNDEQRQDLVQEARKHINDEDPSHDFLHALRVLALAEKIALQEQGDADIVIPAALFHDAINYPKNEPRAALASVHSAQLVKQILTKKNWFPREKIDAVGNAIERCSFSKNLPKERLEEHIVQDADLLESLGAISVARTFASTGQLKRPFYDASDPRGTTREIARPLTNALDLFPVRLFKAKERLYTHTAKKIAERRDAFLHLFYQEFLLDIEP